VADWGGLENRRGVTASGGSNPSPSAPSVADRTRLDASKFVEGLGLRLIKTTRVIKLFRSSLPIVADAIRPDPSNAVGKRWASQTSLC
jgi:hypothetical protein